MKRTLAVGTLIVKIQVNMLMLDLRVCANTCRPRIPWRTTRNVTFIAAAAAAVMMVVVRSQISYHMYGYLLD